MVCFFSALINPRLLYVSAHPSSTMSFTRAFALAVRSAPKQLSPTVSHATPIHVEIGRSRWVHSSRQPVDTTKKTEEKKEAERKSRQELKKLVALENEMEGLEKLEIEVTEKLTKETMYFDKLGRGWIWDMKGLKSRQEMEKEFQEKLKKEREKWDRMQRELTESLERLKAFGEMENEKEEVMRKMRMKKDERDRAVKILVSSYQDVLSSPISSPPPTPCSS